MDNNLLIVVNIKPTKRLLVALQFSEQALGKTVDRRFGPDSDKNGLTTFNKDALHEKFNGKVNICEVCKCLEFESTIVRCPFKRLDRKTLANLDFPDEMHR